MILQNTRFRLFAVAISATAAAIVAHGLTAAGAPSAAPTTRPVLVNLLPPMVISPRPSPKATVAPVPYRSYMPPATVAHDPRILPADGLRPVHAQPALDVPPLAQGGLMLPAEAELPVGPPVRLAVVDSASMPVATIAAKPDLGTAKLTTDPTEGRAPAGALSHTPPPRTNVPPALLLPIPDPSHQAGFIAPNRPATEGAPAADIDRPGPTTLPVK